MGTEEDEEIGLKRAHVTEAAVDLDLSPLQEKNTSEHHNQFVLCAADCSRSRDSEWHEWEAYCIPAAQGVTNSTWRDIRIWHQGHITSWYI